MGTITIWVTIPIAFVLAGTALLFGYLWFADLSEREATLERP